MIANVRALAAYGLNIDDLRTTIANANVNSPKGTLDGPARSWTLNANDQIQSPEAYENVIVAYKNGNPVRLSDVAQVTQGPRTPTSPAGSTTAPGIILNIQRQPGANVIQVVDRIKALLPGLTARLPAAADVTVLTDRTNTIRASVHDVEFELSLAVALVVMVIFLFLRSLPATFIPSLSVPLSLIGTLAVMYLFGYSLDNLSLMALTIATGFVVDDAIVMIENISRYIEQGEPPLEAALQGVRRDRLHHRVADRVADRGADPAALHGRCGGAAVPRVRHHARGHHHHLRGGLAYRGADAVRQAPAPHAAAEESRASRAGRTRSSRRSSIATARRSRGCSSASH